jgi:hypothetical protein
MPAAEAAVQPETTTQERHQVVQVAAVAEQTQPELQELRTQVAAAAAV